MSDGIQGIIPGDYLIRAIEVKWVLHRNKTAWCERTDSDALQAYLGINCYWIGDTII